MFEAPARCLSRHPQAPPSRLIWIFHRNDAWFFRDLLPDEFLSLTTGLT